MLRALSVTLGTILVVYCAAGTLVQKFPPRSSRTSRVLCRFFLCADASAIQDARDQLEGGKREEVQQAVTTFRTVILRNPQDPYRWADLGDAYLAAGRKEDARYCFDQALVLAPRTAVFLLRVADFHFQIGENQKALAIAARILALIPDYDAIIFNEYIHVVPDGEDVLRYGLPENSRAAKSWLEFLIQAARLDDAQRAWEWAYGRGYTNNSLAGEYVEFLIRQGHPDLAASAWAQQSGARAGDYQRANYLFNGDFESEPAKSPYDWVFARDEDVEVRRDCATMSSRNCSLRISFAGKKNIGFAAASQLAFVQPGAYRLHASIRTEALTTDQGIRFRVSDAEVPARLDDVCGQFTGSSPWLVVSHDLLVPRNTSLLRIEIIRQPSMKFDNKIAGTAWVDDVTLEPISSHSSR